MALHADMCWAIGSYAECSLGTHMSVRPASAVVQVANRRVNSFMTPSSVRASAHPKNVATATGVCVSLALWWRPRLHRHAKLPRWAAVNPVIDAPHGLQIDVDLDSTAREALQRVTPEQALAIMSACKADDVKNPSAFVMSRVRKLQPQPKPPSEGSVLVLTVRKLLSHGQGLAFWGPSEWVIMIMGVLPEEVVEVRISRNFKRYSEAKLLRILEKSPDRVEPRCLLYGECNGCQYQHVKYDAQLVWKQRHVHDALSSISGLDLPFDLVDATVPSPLTYHYRTKLSPRLEAAAPIKGDPSHQDVRADGPVGTCAQDWGEHRDSTGRRWRRTIDVEYCPIATEAINDALPRARTVLRERAAKVLKGLSFSQRKAEARRKRGPLMTLLRETTQDGVTQDGWERVLTEEIPGIGVYKFRAGYFFQVNSSILPAFASHVVDVAAQPWRADPHTGPKVLVDVYCGVGFFGIAGRDKFRQVIGIEIDKYAIKLARINASANGAKNVKFYDVRASDGLQQVAEMVPPSETVAIVDPPREGLVGDACNSLTAWMPRRVVYVSCDPATQARDLKDLSAAGYEVCRITPFDLFPQTRHVESVVVLELRASD